MKVKINEEETYEINLKDEYSREEFISLLEKLDKISNLIKSPTLLIKKKSKVEKPTQNLLALSSRGGEKRGKRRKLRIRWDDRKEVIKALRIHYTGTKEEKLAYAKEKGMDWKQLIKAFSGLRRRYNVTPQELGITRFPTRAGKKEKKDKELEITENKKKASSGLNLHHEVKEAVEEGKIPKELALAYNLVTKEDQLKFFKLFSLTPRGLDMQIKALKDFSSLDEKGKEEIRQNLKNL